MKKIVILGCENSHADMFLSFWKQNPKYSDVEVLGVYSHEREAAEKLAAQFGVRVMDSYDEAVGEVDGVIVTARHGDNHYKYAKPYIESGVPMFIDKPVTVSEAEALEMIRACREAGVKVTGGSSCIHVDFVQELKREHQEKEDGETIGGFLRCPVNLDNPHGGFFFYSEHLIGVMTEIFGFDVKSVKAFKNGGNITVVFRYPNFDVTGLYVDMNFTCYSALRVSQHHVHHSEYPITGESECFKIEFDEFYELMHGAKQRKTYDEFIFPVFVMNAIYKSLESGEEVAVNEYKV
ncbi:MAG: Gfo/Idh/MocA family oxidoreductase [Clostridia bacterium]|nr:Gfo/Idh/MocA family oxidoreductase [Clostridia bacterium]